MKTVKELDKKLKKQRKSKLKRSQVVALSICIPAGILFTAITALILGPYADLINQFFSGTKIDEPLMNEHRKSSEELAQDMVKEGAVLLKNENVLPFNLVNENKVNVFGWSSTQWVTGGSGSGRVVSPTGVTDIGTGFIKALNDYGIETNTELTEFYESYASTRPKYADGTLHVWNWQYYRLIEPQICTDYPQTLLNHAEDFSQTAIVVISRVAGESSDAPKVQYKGDKNSQKADDPTRTYLEISKEEEDMLMYVGAHFENVVVVVNSINTMELGFVDIIPGIDACLLVGGTGYNACKAVPEILWGDVSPSGKLSDTYAYELESNPTYVNSGLEGERIFTNSNNSMYPSKNTSYGNVGDSNAKYPGVSYLDYEESIYLGYKWYETADDEGYFDDVSNDYGAGYYGVVQYPFGYGLTYNEGFDWEIVDLKIPTNSNLNADDKIEMTVRVTNTGSFPAKDVVEVYYTPKYIANEIEKASINLAAFAKTSELAPETYEDVKLSFDVYDMASYDCYDMNKNGFKGYELDKGEYQIHLMSDAHTLHDMNVTPETAYEGATITYNIKENIQYENDPDTGAKVSNRFTGSDSIDVTPIDGSSKDGSVKSPLNFLTRKDGFATSFPKEKPARKITEEQLTYNLFTSKQADAWKEANEDKYTEDITTDAKNGLTIEGIFLEGEEKLETLGIQLGGNFDDPRWEQLLDQLTMSEMRNLTLHGYTKTSALPSIGKPEMRDVDGPAQIGSFNVANAGTGFPNATVLAQTWNTNISYLFGIAIGKEAKTLGYDGWYGPGINLHRSPFGGRNYEYFSEDAYLTGAMAAESVRGAKNAGVYCYLKHLAVYDQEEYRDGLYTWLSEQALREIYLKPFKMCVADGGATGIMTSYNRLGGCWVGGSSALLEKVAREEWGFNGTILTDYADHQNYMSMDHALRSGGDLWMDGWLSNGSYKFETSSKSFHHALRLASKHIIYTLLNAYYTNAIYNKSENSEHIIVGQKVDYNESWKIIVGVGEGVIMAGLIAWVILTFVINQHKKYNEQL